jgi:hypothetical protein
MGYYIRVLSQADTVPPISRLRASLERAKLAGTLTVVAGTDAAWKQLVLRHEDGPDIALIERNDRLSGDLVAAEIDEFLEEIAERKPASAAAWLADYLPKVQTIYALQSLSGTDVKNGWDILGKVKDAIHSSGGGIMQADGEGFSDTDGFHILWQFSDSVKGKWWMGVLQDDGFVHFQMDLANKKHRQAFLRGEVPEGVELAGDF